MHVTTLADSHTSQIRRIKGFCTTLPFSAKIPPSVEGSEGRNPPLGKLTGQRHSVTIWPNGTLCSHRVWL